MTALERFWNGSGGGPPSEFTDCNRQSGAEYLTLTTPEERHLSEFAFTPDDRHLVVASPDHHLLVWDLEALKARMEALGLFEATEWSATPKAQGGGAATK